MSIPALYSTYSGATGPVTTTAGTATTYTGLVLTNPLNSPVSLQLYSCGFAPLVAQTSALSLGIMTGNADVAVTQTTPITPVGALTEEGSGFGLLASSATLPLTPAVLLLLGSLLTGAITTVPQGGGLINLIPYNIILLPGSYVAFYTSAASVATSLAFSFTWGEQ
jgi:hypothetical protein